MRNVCTLISEMLLVFFPQIVKANNVSFMFDLNFLLYSNPSHRFWNNFTDIVVQAIKDAGIDLDKVGCPRPLSCATISKKKR